MTPAPFSVRSVIKLCNLLLFCTLLITSTAFYQLPSWVNVNYQSHYFAMAEKTGGISLNNLVQEALQFHKAGKVEQALISYEKAIPQLTGKVRASLSGNVGAIYMSQGNYEKAKEYFESSVDADPENASAHFNLAVVLTSKFQQHGKAIRHCGTALRLDPLNYKAHHLMGNILQAIGRPKEANKYFLKAEDIAIGDQRSEAIAGNEPEGAKIVNLRKKFEELPIFHYKLGQRISKQFDGINYTLECISVRPRIFVVDNLISASECEHIQATAEGKLEKSFVMGGNKDAHVLVSSKQEDKSQTEEGVIDPQLYRSSYNAWLAQDAILEKIQKRLAHILEFPLPYLQQKSEELQVVRYTTGGQFKAHQDSSAFNKRLLTALLYLNTIPSDFDGSRAGSLLSGETWFPFASGQAAAMDSTVGGTVEEAVKAAFENYERSSVTPTTKSLPGLRVNPIQGKSVIFFNHLATGEIDPLAVHAGLPIGLQGNDSLPEIESGDSKGVSNIATERLVVVEEEKTGVPTFSDVIPIGLKDGRTHKWVANYWVDFDPKLFAQY